MSFPWQFAEMFLIFHKVMRIREVYQTVITVQSKIYYDNIPDPMQDTANFN